MKRDILVFKSLISSISIEELENIQKKLTNQIKDGVVVIPANFECLGKFEIEDVHTKKEENISNAKTLVNELFGTKTIPEPVRTITYNFKEHTVPKYLTVGNTFYEVNKQRYTIIEHRVLEIYAKLDPILKTYDPYIITEHENGSETVEKAYNASIVKTWFLSKEAAEEWLRGN